jgi:hypothetical protein
MGLLYEAIRVLRRSVSSSVYFLNIDIDLVLNAGWAKEESARGVVEWFDRFTA